jgi:hypothetical protein
VVRGLVVEERVLLTKPGVHQIGIGHERNVPWREPQLTGGDLLVGPLGTIGGHARIVAPTG